MTLGGAVVVAEDYLRQAGTSMSAPHVSGLAALILEAHPLFSNEQVRQAIRHASDDIGIPGFDTDVGHGRINAGRSLTEETHPLAVLITQPRIAATDAIEQIDVAGVVSGAELEEWTLHASPLLGGALATTGPMPWLAFGAYIGGMTALYLGLETAWARSTMGITGIPEGAQA